MRTSTPSRGTPSYTTPDPVSVMPYVVTTLAGSCSGGAAPPRTMMRNNAESIRLSAVATNETSVAPADSTASTSKPGSTVTGVPVTSARVTTDNPPTWASGKQASQGA